MPNDEKRIGADGKELNKATAAFGGMVQALKSVDIWAVALNGFVVYCIYCGLTYFIPFLNNIYLLPATAVGAYGIINQYGLKMVGGPIGGFMSDKVHKSSAKHIRMGFIVCIVAMALFLMIPHGGAGRFRQLDHRCCLHPGLRRHRVHHACRVLRPHGRGKGSRRDHRRCHEPGFSGHLPAQLLRLPYYGNFLDRFPGMTGYRIVFGVMIGWAVIGVFVSTFLIGRIKKHQQAGK